MSKFKRWLYDKFLPVWCREDLLSVNAKLSARVQEQVAEIAQLRAYIDGMQTAIRRSPRITVYGSGGKDE